MQRDDIASSSGTAPRESYEAIVTVEDFRSEQQIKELRLETTKHFQQSTDSAFTQLAETVRPLSRTAGEYLSDARSKLQRASGYDNDLPGAIEDGLRFLQLAADRLRERKTSKSPFAPSHRKLDDAADQIEQFIRTFAPDLRQRAADFIRNMSAPPSRELLDFVINPDGSIADAVQTSNNR